MKKYFFLTLSLAVIYLALKEQGPVVETEFPAPVRKIASQATPPTPKKETVLLPAKQNTSYKQVERKVRERVSPRTAEDFQQDPSYKLTRGHVFISNVGAIPKENYKSTMGEILYQDSVFVFVRSNGDKALLPVAYSPSTGKLHPISSILHVDNATESVRSEVKGLGFQEYYYSPGAKLLSVQSTQTEVLEVYSDLKDRGFEVQLEVVRPHQQGI
ncbi:hypothetical protein [Peredibacter starrii]|uniref:Uncharacterized protein n=1 Tax=Peredibacter starrii TaxID=28202 RepID=A0AAX4HM21_9BACT|nr:hypothetical protein [Peredibacter starrii]WPU64173.1 hypothetical protein SOO65_15875 [Peredibacter starrii]